MQRFFLREPLAVGKTLALGVERQHQLKHVLRAAIGDTVELINGQSDKVYRAVLSASGRHDFQAMIVEETEVTHRVPCRLTLCVGQIKPNRFEWLIQKAAELGVARIVPLLTERVQKRPERVERWEKIAIEAVEQSKQTRLPEISPPLGLSEVLSQATEHWMIASPEAEIHMASHLLASSAKEYGVLIGPEGGWTTSELNQADQRGILAVSLGGAILRAETAGIVSAAIVMALAEARNID